MLGNNQGLQQDAFEGNALAKSLFQILKEYTCFPGTLISTQCKRIGKTCMTLEAKDLPVLVEAIEKALANFSTPLKIQVAKQEILKLSK